MSHLLSTVNPDAAASLQEIVQDVMAVGAVGSILQTEADTPTEPVWRDGDPDVSDWVIYQPRRGMIRRGRNRVAALVVHRHPTARLLDLAIFYEAGDTLDDQRVPEAVGDERGWLVKQTSVPQVIVNHAARDLAEVRQDIDQIRALILGTFKQPEHSVLDLLSMLDERVDKLETTKPKTKRKYTRKAKTAPKPEPKAE